MWTYVGSETSEKSILVRKTKAAILGLGSKDIINMRLVCKGLKNDASNVNKKNKMKET